jgi:adenine-specific DNA-methyltransferase
MANIYYIGNKTRLLHFIDESLRAHGIERVRSIADLFAGTGSVVVHFVKTWKTRRVLANDLQHLTAVILRGLLLPANATSTLPVPKPKKGFFSNQYAGTYFSEENARLIDGWLAALGPDDDYARTCLMEAVARVSNTTGVYQAYLKHIKPSARATLAVVPVARVPFGRGTMVLLNQRAEDVRLDHRGYDLVYLDPPYNDRNYSTNYHILETIARGDAPALRTGITKIRSDCCTSAFNSKREVGAALARVLDNCVDRCRHVCVSYNSEGLLSSSQITSLLEKCGYTGIKMYTTTYRRYSSHARGEKNVLEHLFIASGRFK